MQGLARPASYTSGTQPVAWPPERERRGAAPDRGTYACPDRDCVFASASLAVMVGHVRGEHRAGGPPSYAPAGLPPQQHRMQSGVHAAMTGAGVPPDLSTGRCMPGNHPPMLDGAWDAEDDHELTRAAVHACRGCAVLALCTRWAVSLAGTGLDASAGIVAGLGRSDRLAARHAMTAEPGPYVPPEAGTTVHPSLRHGRAARVR